MTNTGSLRKRCTRPGEPGQIFTLVAMALVVLLGFTSLAVDVGFLWNKRRQLQTAADAAAIGGMEGLTDGSVASSALNDAALNGFRNAVDGVSVTVNNPPASGIYAGDPEAVEAIVTQTVPTYFLAALGFKTVPVSARAVAHVADSRDCIFVLDPSASSAMTVGGGAILNAQCGVQVNSSASNALNMNGGACLTATSIGVVGNYTPASCGPTPTPVTGVVAATDPLAGLAAPTVGGCDYPKTSVKGIQHLDPGVYCGGITVGSNSTAILNPGLYILNGGGLTVGSNADIQGTGVTFYNTGGKSYKGISVQGGNNTFLSAPTSGPFEAILFFNDRTVTGVTNSITGGSTAKFEGTLYFPTVPLSFGGGSSSTAYTLIIADTLKVAGSSTLNANYSGLANGSPIKMAGLGE
jgi:Putative Flp pilus-assembly TadE/G-like